MENKSESGGMDRYLSDHPETPSRAMTTDSIETGQNPPLAEAAGSKAMLKTEQTGSSPSPTPPGKGTFAQMDKLLLATALISTAIMLTLVLAQAWALAKAGKDFAPIYNLLMVGAAAFGMGNVAGFVFGATGDEKQTFGGISTALNGIVGGFALGDLTKSDSTIKAILMALANACGLNGVGLVGCVTAFYASAGFLFMYMNKQYLLNPAISRKQMVMEKNQKIAFLTRSIKVSLTEIGNKPYADDKTAEQIKAALGEFEACAKTEPELVDLFTIEALKCYSKAYYAIGDLGKAEIMLRKSRCLSPDDADTLFYLSHVLLGAQRQTEAIPYLSYLESSQNAPVLTWKLLGYACLFDPNRLSDAERTSTKYLAVYPNDPGALLNLACVNGQRGISNPENVKACLGTLQRVIVLNPGLRPFIKETLTAPGEDFAEWVNLPGFQNL